MDELKDLAEKNDFSDKTIHKEWYKRSDEGGRRGCAIEASLHPENGCGAYAERWADGHRMRIEFQNGVKHGDSYFIGPYGGVIWQGTYVKGVRHGEWVEWEKGRMVFYTYDHGTEVKKEAETMEGRKRIR